MGRSARCRLARNTRRDVCAAHVGYRGCFLASMATTQYMSALADSLRRAGIATWNIEYRSVDSPGGGWPETYRDVGRAADNVRALAHRFPLDTTRVIAIGHSAGGFPDPSQALAFTRAAAAARRDAANYDAQGRRLLPWYVAVARTYWALVTGVCCWAIYQV